MASNRKRGQNEGSVFARDDGRWSAALSVGGGRRVYVYGATAAEAREKLHDMRQRRKDGLPAAIQRQTVSQLIDVWLESVRPSLRFGTWRKYESNLRLHVRPTLGIVRVAELGPADLERLYGSLGRKGLAPQSVVHVHRTIHALLAKASKWEIVPRNVAALADVPRVPRVEMQTLSPDEVRRLLDAARGSRYEALWRLAVGTGMRRGEMLGLKWDQVDLDAGVVRVVATLDRSPDGLVLTEPKTKRSRRSIHLSPSIVAALREHRGRQNAERLRLGPAWQDTGFVFTTTVGTPVNANSVIPREFKPLLAKAGIGRHVRIHDLRHTAISFALSASVAPTDVAEMAGHSSVAVTLTTYAHALPDAPMRAAAAIEKVIAGA